MSAPSPGPVLDSTAFPHIIDNVLEHLAIDHPAALALQTTCRAWRDKLRSAVFAHVRAGVLWLDPVGPLSGMDWVVVSSYRFSTVPPTGGRAVYLPAQTYSRDRYTNLEDALTLPHGLVAVSPLIQALDIRGPVPYGVLKQLFQMKIHLVLLRMDEFFPGAECTDRDSMGRAYAQWRDPPRPIWFSSPLNYLVATGGENEGPSALTVHLDLSTMSTIEPFLDSRALPRKVNHIYIILFPTDSPSGLHHYFRILYMPIGIPVTYVGFDALDLFRDRNNADPRDLWDEFLNSDSIPQDPRVTMLLANPPFFLTYGEYEEQFGRGTHCFQTPGL